MISSAPYLAGADNATEINFVNDLTVKPTEQFFIAASGEDKWLGARGGNLVLTDDPQKACVFTFYPPAPFRLCCEEGCLSGSAVPGRANLVRFGVPGDTTNTELYFRANVPSCTGFNKSIDPLLYGTNLRLLDDRTYSYLTADPSDRVSLDPFPGDKHWTLVPFKPLYTCVGVHPQYGCKRTAARENLAEPFSCHHSDPKRHCRYGENRTFLDADCCHGVCRLPTYTCTGPPRWQCIRSPTYKTGHPINYAECSKTCTEPGLRENIPD